MNLLYLVGTTSKSLSQVTQLVAFARDFADLDHRITVMFPAELARVLARVLASQKTTNDGVQYIALPVPLSDERFQTMTQLKAIRRQYKKEQYDLICVDRDFVAMALFSTLGYKTPIVVNVPSGFRFNWSNVLVLRLKRIYKLLLSSEDDRDHAMEEGRLPPEKLVVNYDEFLAETIVAPNSTIHRGIVGIPNNGFAIGVAGSDLFLSELGDVITVFDHLRAQNLNLYLVLTGITRADLRRNSISLSAQQLRRIRFIDGECLERGDFSLFDLFFVITAPKQGVSWMVREVMAHKLPVLAFDSAGNRELIKHNKTGLLVQDSDLDALYNILLYAITNQAVLAEMAGAALSAVSASMSHAVRTKKLIALYQDVSSAYSQSLLGKSATN